MSFPRATLFCAALIAGGAALAQNLPEGLTRNGDVVMMQPIPDGTSGGSAHPSRLRVLSASDHDLFTRAFEAAGRGDWASARGLAAQGQSPVAKRLLEWRYA